MNSILSAVVGVTLALAAVEADAQATPGERQVSLTIESTSLATALDKWAQQSGFQVFVQDWEAAKNLSAPSLKGTFSAQAALEQLLEGTPLTYVWLNGKAVSIRKKAPQTVPAALQRTGLEGQPPIPVAKFSGDDAGGQSRDTLKPDNRGAAPADAKATSRSSAPAVETLEQIIVTGSHIRGASNSAAPVTILGRDYIESSGVSTVARLLESLPQNFALANPSVTFIPGATSPRDQGAAIDLRGLGEGTTLTLLNGRRMAPGFAGSAVDISALPLSAIERVEVLTDGASALYGSDAIGGVVNFILRRDFEGAETRVGVGSADGVDEYRASQALGTSWESGNGLISAEYYSRGLLSASERDFVADDSVIGSLYPKDENYSVLVSGRQGLTDSVDVVLDALYTRRESYNESGRTTFNEATSTTNPQLSASLGLEWQLAGDWQLDTFASYGRNERNQEQRDTSDTFLVKSLFEIEAAQIKADGGLFSLPGGDVRAAVGVDWRSESFSTHNRFVVGGTQIRQDFDQIVRSAFAEVRVPVVGPSNSLTGLHRVEVSIAGRYDDYSTFGSSFDPQFGLVVEPLPGLRLRGTHGTSYKAPKLTDYDLAFNLAGVLLFPDPAAVAGFSQQLWVFGNDATGYAPQESESTSFGFQFLPPSVEGLELAVNYYRISYRNQITSPPDAVTILFNEPSFGSLLIRDPSVDQVNRYAALGQLGGLPVQSIPPITAFDPNAIDVIMDLRRRNLGVLRTSGLDTSIQYAFRAGDGQITLGLNGTYIFELDRQVTSSSTSVDAVDTFYNPPQFRGRGSVGWQNGAWIANAIVNYTDAYTDTRTGSDLPVSSYTTVDARLALDVGELSKSGFWSGVTIALTAQNLLDQDPPKAAVVASISDMGFDPTNSNPMGRLIGLEIVKSW